MKDKNFLSGDEVCKIIESASKARVTKLKFGDLEVFFTPGGLEPADLGPGPALPGALAQISVEQAKEQEAAILKEEILTREDQMAELWLTDPAEAERLLELGELAPAPEPEVDDE